MKDLELVCQGNGLMTGMRLQIPVIISAAFSKADAVFRKSHARHQDRCCRKNIPGFLMKFLVHLFRMVLFCAPASVLRLHNVKRALSEIIL